MKFSVVAFHPVAAWKWDTSSEPHKLYHYASRPSDEPGAATGYDDDDEDEDDDLCGICQAAFEACCPECKVPGDDCPLSESFLPHSKSAPPFASKRIASSLEIEQKLTVAVWGECTHVFHMHCLLKWIDTESSKQQCPLDRRPWGEWALLTLCAQCLIDRLTISATADRKPDRLPTTTTGVPVPHLPQGSIPEEVVNQANTSREDESFNSAHSGGEGLHGAAVVGNEATDGDGTDEGEEDEEGSEEDEMEVDHET